jgi:hypothetical protein
MESFVIFNTLFDTNKNKSVFVNSLGIGATAFSDSRIKEVLGRKFTSLGKPSALVSITYKTQYDTNTNGVKLLMLCGYGIKHTTVIRVSNQDKRLRLHDGFTEFIDDNHLQDFIEKRLSEYTTQALVKIQQRLNLYRPKVIKSRRKCKRFNEHNEFGKDFKFWRMSINGRRVDPFLIEKNFKGFHKTNPFD